MLRLLLNSILVFFIICSPLFAANHYVLEGGSGDGSSWSSAWDDLPATLTRGDTYYIGDGTYDAYDYNDAESGSDVITIKKATETDHGTETGWSSTYGDGQATFGKPDFETGYYTIEGNTTTLESYGFSFPSGGGGENIDIGDGTSGDVNYIVIRNSTVNCGGTASERAIKINGGNNITLYNVELHNCDNDLISMEGADNLTLDSSHLHTRNSAGVGTHGDALEIWGCDNLTVKNTKIDWDGQQFFWGGGFSNTTITLYGNIQYGGTNSGKCLHKHSTATVSGLVMYNSTCADMNTQSVGPDGTYTNNLWYDVPNPGSGTHSYGYYKTGMTVTDGNAQYGGDPFTDYAGEDLTLSAATNAGTDLGSTYNTDREGNTRGDDGTWDRGAYEYGSGTSASGEIIRSGVTTN